MDKTLLTHTSPDALSGEQKETLSDEPHIVNDLRESTASEDSPYGYFDEENGEISDTSPADDENSDGEPPYTEAEEQTDTVPESAGGAQESTGATFESDLGALLSEFPEISSRLSEGFVNTERYAKLRSLGLTPTEAYLATSRTRSANNRSHLVSSVPAGARTPMSGMSASEMENAKYLFSDLTEREIVALFNRVNK